MSSRFRTPPSPLTFSSSISKKFHLSQLLILSLFDYTDTIYIPSKRLLHCIQRIQNLCFCFSYDSRKSNHITPLFKQFGWLNIQLCFILHLCCLVFNVLQSNTPSYLRNFLHLNSEFHSSSLPATRFHDFLSVPSHRSLKLRSSFSYTAAKYFNSLPPDIRFLFSIFFRTAASHLTSLIFKLPKHNHYSTTCKRLYFSG